MIVRKFAIPDLARQREAGGERSGGFSGMGPSGELAPFHPARLAPADLIGRTIAGAHPSFGTYGMGGPGFFALRLNPEWLVISLWGAGDWMMAEDRLVTDLFYQDHGRPRPWIGGEGDDLAPRLIGRRIAALDLKPRSLRITLADGFALEIDERPERRPAFAGSGKPRAFADDEDLRDAVFLCPADELWTA